MASALGSVAVILLQSRQSALAVLSGTFCGHGLAAIAEASATEGALEKGQRSRSDERFGLNTLSRSMFQGSAAEDHLVAGPWDLTSPAGQRRQT